MNAFHMKFAAITNIITFVVAVICATAYWNDPAMQFRVGMITCVAVWCGCDLMKDLLGL